MEKRKKSNNPFGVSILSDELSIMPREALYIYRKRNKLNQDEAAEHFDVTKTVYRIWETLGIGDIPVLDVEPLTIQEKCILKRRKSGKTIQEIADEMGKSANYIIQLESQRRKNIQVLANYWNID